MCAFIISIGRAYRLTNEKTVVCVCGLPSRKAIKSKHKKNGHVAFWHREGAGGGDLRAPPRLLPEEV